MGAVAQLYGGAVWGSCVVELCGGSYVCVCAVWGQLCGGAVWGSLCGGAGFKLCVWNCASCVSDLFTKAFNMLLCGMFQLVCCRVCSCGSVKSNTLIDVTSNPHKPPFHMRT